MSSQVDADIPMASAPIVMLSLPETQDTPQDVFHTPPEESSLPSSVDVEQCAANKAAYDDSGSQGYVDFGLFSDVSDLGKDFELGFAETKLSQEIDNKLVSNLSQGAEGSSLEKVPEPHFDEFRASKRETAVLGELPPVKKMKPLEQNLGKLVSDADGESVQPQENVMGCQKMDVDIGKGGDLCREISVDKIISNDEKFETEEVVQGDGEVKGKKSIDEVGEGSGMQEEHVPRRVLPVSIQGEATNEMESSNGKDKEKYNVFAILKALVKEVTDDEDGDNVNGDYDDGSGSLLKAVKKSGITFPRPRWWPNNFKSEFLNTSKTHSNVNLP